MHRRTTGREPTAAAAQLLRQQSERRAPGPGLVAQHLHLAVRGAQHAQAGVIARWSPVVRADTGAGGPGRALMSGNLPKATTALRRTMACVRSKAANASTAR
jgi:hypothetical protein